MLRVFVTPELNDVRRRVQFTLSDDEKLCTYLARIQPYMQEYGRASNRVYEQLLELVRHFPYHFTCELTVPYLGRAIS